MAQARIHDLCLACGKPIQAIGDRRANGAAGLRDWDERKYHKKCHIMIPYSMSAAEKAAVLADARKWYAVQCEREEAARRSDVISEADAAIRRAIAEPRVRRSKCVAERKQ